MYMIISSSIVQFSQLRTSGLTLISHHIIIILPKQEVGKMYVKVKYTLYLIKCGIKIDFPC